MKRNVLASFVAGLFVATVATGGVTWLQASSDSVVTACANKKTGALRYLTKGKCNKRTESQVSWNSSGVPGPQGPIGPKGDKGDVGTRGDSAGPWIVKDSTGKTLGQLLSTNGYNTDLVFLDENGGAWEASSAQSNYFSNNESAQFFEDTNCTRPVMVVYADAGATVSDLRRLVINSRSANADFVPKSLRGFKASSTTKEASDFPNLYYFADSGLSPNISYTCSNYKLRQNWETQFWGYSLASTSEVPLPSFSAPLSISEG
jgi:hypothetical protein